MDENINEQVARKLGWTITGECGGLKAFRNFKETEFSEQEYIPNYAGSIQAAWEIVEHQKYAFSLARDAQYPLWDAWFAGGDHVQADTAPLAICLAFLELP